MRFGLTLMAGACALSGCIGQPLTIGAPGTAQDAARQTCLANFGLAGGEALTADQAQQLNGCMAQSLADSTVASGGLVPLTPLAPVGAAAPVSLALADNPNFRAAAPGCLPGGGVLQGGTRYCTAGGVDG